MLLQHHTVSLINSGIPEGWEEDMAFGVGEAPRGGMKKKVGRRGQRARARAIKHESEEGDGEDRDEDLEGDEYDIVE
jgi:hypothetical protein